MTRELRDRVAALRAIAPELNAATDEVNAVVEAVERLLCDELKIGVSAEVRFAHEDLDVDDEDGVEWPRYKRSYLAFGRLHGSYQIHVQEVTEKDGVDDR